MIQKIYDFFFTYYWFVSYAYFHDYKNDDSKNAHGFGNTFLRVVSMKYFNRKAVTKYIVRKSKKKNICNFSACILTYKRISKKEYNKSNGE